MKKPITMLLVVLLIASCKSNKKVTDLSNKDAKEQTTSAPEKTIKVEEKESVSTLKAKEVTMAERQLTLTNYFNAISNASSTTSANNSINEALTMFSSSNTSVLIIIYKDGDDVDYDEPTVIKDYLNYLKDQKKNINRIESMELDGNGKIKSLELIRSK